MAEVGRRHTSWPADAMPALSADAITGLLITFARKPRF